MKNWIDATLAERPELASKLEWRQVTAIHFAIRFLVESLPDLSNVVIAVRISAALGVPVDARTVAGYRHSKRYQSGKALEVLKIAA